MKKKKKEKHLVEDQSPFWTLDRLGFFVFDWKENLAYLGIEKSNPILILYSVTDD